MKMATTAQDRVVAEMKNQLPSVQDHMDLDALISAVAAKLTELTRGTVILRVMAAANSSPFELDGTDVIRIA
jgi:hypothetical protein